LSSFRFHGPLGVLAVTGALVSFALVGPAAADEPTTDDATKAPAVEETLVVTATLEPEERADVPATVRLITAEEIRSRAAESVLPLVGSVAGSHGVTYGAPGQLGSLFVRGSDSNQTLVLWNGLQLNDPLFGAFNWAFLSTDGIERIEVVPGPFSALYGSSAMGGVVQVLTGHQSGVRAVLEAGENDHQRVAVDAGYAAGPFQASATGHHREGNGGLGNDAYEGDEATARLGWAAPGRDLDAGLLLRWNDSETGVPFVGVTPSPLRHIAWEELEWGLPVSAVRGAWEAAGNVSQVRYDNAFRDPEDAFGFTSSDTTSRADRARLQMTRRFATGGWAAGGGEWERQTVTDSSAYGPNLDDAQQRTGSVFAQLHLEGERWSLDAGVRHDDNDVFGSATSPRLGAVVALGAMARLRASYGESFRAPSLGELYYPFYGNPALQPEEGRSAELGLELADGPWRFDVVAFENRQDNLIDFPLTGSGFVNVGRARSRGVEVMAAVRHGIADVRLDGTWLDAEDRTTGAALKLRPEHAANLVAAFRPGRFDLSVAASWVGERPDSDPITFAPATNPSYFTVGLAAHWQATSWLRPFVRVDNAADESYQQALGFPAPGRAFIGGVRIGR
jgi:vitamin B12 transporter